MSFFDLCLDGSISKVKLAFSSSLKDPLNDLFRSLFGDCSKLSHFGKTKGYRLAIFSENELF